MMEIRLDIDINKRTVRADGEEEVIGAVIIGRHPTRFLVVVEDAEKLPGVMEAPGPDSPYYPGRQAKPA